MRSFLRDPVVKNGDQLRIYAQGLDEKSEITSLHNYQINKVEIEPGWDEFADGDDLKEGKTYIWNNVKEVTAPVGSFSSFLNIILLGIIKTVLFVVINIGGLITRGWRLEIVRRIGLDRHSNSFSYIPEISFDNLIDFLKKGFVLFVARGVYFLPHAIVIFIFAKGQFDLFWDIGNWMYEKFWLSDTTTFGELLMYKIIPEFTISIIIQVVMIMLYVILVWPVYRITMIKYGLGLIRGRGFFNRQIIANSIHIYRKYFSEILGIYFFVLFVDFITIICTLFIYPFLSIVTLGLFTFLIPTVNLFVKHWPKAYCYGVLARRLIRLEAIKLK